MTRQKPPQWPGGGLFRDDVTRRDFEGCEEDKLTRLEVVAAAEEEEEERQVYTQNN